jgi:hypothetical protein
LVDFIGTSAAVVPCDPGCQNNGVCKSNECICAGGWAGDYCQHKSALTLPPLKVVIGFVVISIASWKIGTFVSALKLPIITGYLFTGVLAGPFVLNVIPNSTIRRLDFVGMTSLPIPLYLSLVSAALMVLAVYNR